MGTLDFQVIEKFKEFQEKTGKYSDLDIENIELELLPLYQVANFPAMTRITGGVDISINDFNSLPEEEQNNYFALVSGTVENNQVSGYIHKDRLSPTSLSSPNVISWTRINGQCFFIQARPVCTNDDSFIMDVIQNKFIVKYVRYATMQIMKSKSFDWGNKAGKNKVKEIEIPIPQDYNEQYKSIDIQKAIVEFLEFWKINYTDIFRHTVSHQKPIIEKIKKALISATLRYDKTMVHSFNEFASNKGFNLKLDEIKFENSTLGNIIDLIGGDRITKKNNSGTIYPVYGGGDVSFKTDTYNRENEYVIGRFAISETCVRFINKKFHLLDSGFTFKIKNHLEEILDKNFIGGMTPKN
ncbi:hypothetical protein [Sulfuricurvum sp. RIFCSPLOWO2_12_FULL_43_24]|uniref:hypothetical protein n=1 Tax=Sulfuricurvum sp. RIFCSPLOWO2_12_FULL_43_24 TaxID=1802247 RepID=UPI0025F4C213|nr:hypothetical protein [Sulfuricurvum sp. RIFCSPLOWO2_12_FULL_43_24]